MGWLFTQGQTRSELIEKLVRLEENESGRWQTHRHCTRGNVLWTVAEVTSKATRKTERYIGCILLRSDKGYGWGYKDMTESVGPCYYTCPLSYLEDVPVANQAWRDAVKHYHRKYAIGDRLKLSDCRIPHIDVISNRPFIGLFNGQRYRIPRDRILEVMSTT